MDNTEVPYFTNAKEGYVPAKLAQRNSATQPLRLLQFVVRHVIPDVLQFLVRLVPLLLQGLVGLVLPAQKKSIRGQTALVTGGANGLGRALCLRLAREGCHVAVVDIDLPGAQRTAEDVRQLGVKAEAFLADIASSEEVDRLRLAVETKLGPVDVLVNNAGLLAVLSLSEGKATDLERIINVNLLSHFWTIRAFMEGMKERRRGHILAVSSIMGYIALPRSVSYAATKFAVRGMMQALQRELTMDGFGEEIFTTTVFPTFIATRKELMDLLNELSFDEKLAILTPEEAAGEAVEGMLHGHTRVLAAPFFIRLFIYLTDLLPCALSSLLLETITGKLPQLTKRTENGA
uniref:Short-chain dehydrogenase/reductase 3 n=1 Tax=Anopheles atroparvus TaxID=41427 RepID=A0AAG5D5G5_ANOAO